jgi:hypothetical protein
MKKWQVISNDGYKGLGHLTKLAAEVDMHKSNIFEIEESKSRRWHVVAVEDPEPVDLGRVAMEAFEMLGGGWDEQSPRLRDGWRAAAAAVIAAAAVPKKS